MEEKEVAQPLGAEYTVPEPITSVRSGYITKCTVFPNGDLISIADDMNSFIKGCRLFARMLKLLVDL